MLRTIFMQLTAEIIAFKYSTEMVNSSARLLSIFPSRQMQDPRLATKQIIHLVRERQVLPGQFASPHRHIKCCSVLMHFRVESTSSAWMGRFLGCSASPENS